MDAIEQEYQRIVDARIHAKVDARIKAMALRARADAKRHSRQYSIPKRVDRQVFQTRHGPAYTVDRKSTFGIGTVSARTIRISLPYLSILGESG